MTTTEIHGHEVIALIRALPAPLEREALVQLIDEHFGNAARFCTCSASDMTSSALVAFFVGYLIGTRLAGALPPDSLRSLFGVL